MIRLKYATIYTDNGEKELMRYVEDRLFEPDEFNEVAAETIAKYSKLHPGCELRLTMRDESIDMTVLNIDRQ